MGTGKTYEALATRDVTFDKLNRVSRTRPFTYPAEQAGRERRIFGKRLFLPMVGDRRSFSWSWCGGKVGRMRFCFFCIADLHIRRTWSLDSVSHDGSSRATSSSRSAIVGSKTAKHASHVRSVF